MKKIILILIVFFYNFCFSQILEGHVQYDIQVKAIDTSLEIRQQVQLLRNSKMDLFFSKGKYRVDFKMGELYSSSTRINKLNDKILTLFNSKKGSFASLNNTDDANYSEDVSSEIQFFNDKKIILGFNCKKALIKDKENKTLYWYTTDIQIEKFKNQIVNPLIPGFPIKFSTIKNGVEMIYSASNFEDSLSTDKKILFSTEIPPGYQMKK